MTLETDVLAAISLAGIAMTVIFVVAINFFVGRKDNPKSATLTK